MIITITNVSAAECVWRSGAGGGGCGAAVRGGVGCGRADCRTLRAHAGLSLADPPPHQGQPAPPLACTAHKVRKLLTLNFLYRTTPQLATVFNMT